MEAEPSGPDGVTTVVVEGVNASGKQVRITRKIKKTVVMNRVPVQVAARRRLAKYGEVKGFPPGPDTNSTSLGEVVKIRMAIIRATDAANEDDSNSKMKDALSKAKIVCRTCGGGHWTTKCPFKDSSLGSKALDLGFQVVCLNLCVAGTDAGDAAAAKSAAGKYVPPSQRAGGTGGRGEMMSERRDDFFTMRITNLSEDVQEMDVKDLVSRFGQTARVFVARHMGTDICKGFAFVSYYSRQDCQDAIDTLNGYGYDNLILSVEWSKREEKKPGT